jgi:hypothetical protein
MASQRKKIFVESHEKIWIRFNSQISYYFSFKS